MDNLGKTKGTLWKTKEPGPPHILFGQWQSHLQLSYKHQSVSAHKHARVSPDPERNMMKV